MASNGQAQGAESLENSEAAFRRVAYLGPPGTYGNQVSYRIQIIATTNKHQGSQCISAIHRRPDGAYPLSDHHM